MRVVSVFLLAGGTSMLLAACGSSVSSLDDFEARSSYAIGMDVGRSVKATKADINQDALVQGLLDILNDRDPRLTPEEAAATLQEFGSRLQQAQAGAAQELAEKNRRDGDAFLAENATKEGVTVTASGLQYEVLTAGDGPRPKATDRVRVHYRGTFTDGTEFENSRTGGGPVTFPVNGVISGWTEGLQLMPVGSTYRFAIPSDLAYGEAGSRGMEPNRTLVFEVELLEILP